MALTIDGKVLRNLEEQVQKNKEDIAKHYAIDRSLANFGIKIVGTVLTENQLPDPLTYQGEYGDGYAVGQTGAYVYYIFTRPDLNSGHPDSYWLNVGSISIVGPQGPQGPKGDKGDTGESTRFYASANYPLDANEGDLYLGTTGMVYEYVNNDWIARTNIRGPQGIQGIQGPRGIQGPQGETGPQGPRGDVGGFISIAGILSSTNQLPLPSKLGNLTVAYLVGATEPYDLYIQIGETSAEATWNNVGPLNVATMVTVNGQYQNIWEADTKLDKITTTGASRLYSINGQGKQGTMNYGQTPVASWIPMYEPQQGGALQVGTPLKDVHATPKKYVDDLIASVKWYKHTFSLRIYDDTSLSVGYIDNEVVGYAPYSTQATTIDEMFSTLIPLKNMRVNYKYFDSQLSDYTATTGFIDSYGKSGENDAITMKSINSIGTGLHYIQLISDTVVEV